MSRSLPIATVGVPVYNGDLYLARTLEALQKQELADIEVLVADNASTDSSLEIAESFAEQDDRFRILRSDVNRGSTWNYNRLLCEASAPLFMWNSADDIILPAHVRICRQLLLDHPDAVLAFSRALRINAQGERIDAYDDEGLDFFSASPVERLELFFGHRVWYAAFGGLYRTEILRSVGGYLPFYGQDIALATKMALRAPWVQAQDQSYLLRVHNEQMTNLQGADPVLQTSIFTPNHKRPVAFPAWYLTYRLVVEVLTAPISFGERVRALAVTARGWVRPNWRSYPFDMKRNAIRLAKGRYIGAYHSGT